MGLLALGIGFLALLIVGGEYWRFFLAKPPPFSFRSPTPIEHLTLADLTPTGVADGGLPSLTDPAFVSIDESDQYLVQDGEGLLVLGRKEQKFYPFQLLVWHPVVNDTVDGLPVLITFNPLVWSATIHTPPGMDKKNSFKASSFLWNNNVLIEDSATNSLWSPLRGEAILGQRKGDVLRPCPFDSVIVSWKSVVESDSNQVKVLAIPSEFDRDYAFNPYGAYQTNADILFPLQGIDARLPLKERVVGVVIDGKEVAYPRAIFQTRSVINDTVGNKHVVLFVDPRWEGIRTFSFPVGEHDSLVFHEETDRLFDQEGGEWSWDGAPLHPDSQTVVDKKNDLNTISAQTIKPNVFALEPLERSEVMWLGWYSSYPDTLVYSKDK